MADKLDWQNKHLVLLRYISLQDAVQKENYKIRPDLEEFFVKTNNAEQIAFSLAEQGKHKDACELLAYICHRRAGVWWGYQCVNSLIEELRINPAVDRDIADIAKDFTVEVPDFAKVDFPPPDPEMDKQYNMAIQQIRDAKNQMKSMLDPKELKLSEQIVNVAFGEFEKTHGIHPLELLKKLGEKLNESRFEVDPQSPVFVEAAKLKTQLGQVQKETADLIKSVIPPKVPAHEKKMRDNALGAVYRWINAPDEPNSKACLDIGNECPDTPAGLLSLSAFWAYGNLMPGGDQVIQTPPGLAANGLTQVFLMCALHKGGTRKPKERFEQYFNKGIEVLTGKDNWESSLLDAKAPHEKELPPVAKGKDQNTGTDEEKPAVAYKRWKKD
ncbi:MAG: hypothetical protein LBV68_06295 [Spirochaetaceae bacterium]|jgi:hypothetical protein|nr:hypothetical protein [Spirochaetaceae bacterium]